jgi:hypothetical protein
MFRLKEHITEISPFEELLRRVWRWVRQSSWLQRGGVLLLTLLSGYVIAVSVAFWGGRIRFNSWWGWPVGVLVRHLPKRAIWAMFVRYRPRARKAFADAEKNYYPLPATRFDRTLIPAAPSALIGAIAETSGPHAPVWVVGPGGAGKSTVLRRIVWEAAGNSGPRWWQGYYPVLVGAQDFDQDGTLIGAITSALARNHRVSLPPDIVQSLLSVGRFLILADGISEIDRPGLDDPAGMVAGAASHQNLATCRFVLAGRFAPAGTEQVIELDPLTPAYIQESIVPHAGLTDQQQQDVAVQLQQLGGTPIAPLLLRMIIDAVKVGQMSRTVADLYRRFFAHLLHTSDASTEWEGWSALLAQLAGASLIEGGKRGKAVGHKDALGILSRLKHDEKPVVDQLEYIYGIPRIKGALAVLRALDRANILLWANRTWGFRHDRFEEYFAALYLIDIVETTEEWPPLTAWLASEEKHREFVDVLEFAARLDTKGVVLERMPAEHPQLWRSVLTGASDDELHTISQPE